MKRILNWRFLALAVIVTVAVSGLVFIQDVRIHLENFIDWVKTEPVWGPVLFILVYVLACLFAFPGSLLTLGAGYAFHIVKGLIIVVIGSNLGSWVAFYAGRYFARGLLEDRIKNNPRFNALDQAVAREGFKIVLLTRLSPVFPFVYLNYAFGLTRVRFRDYALATWLGMLPGAVMYIYLGYLASVAKNEVADLFQGKLKTTPAQWVLFVIGLLATIAVTLFITNLARKALAKAAPEVTTKSNE